MTYDYITDQFSTDLSPLAKRMYATIFEKTNDPREENALRGWEIDIALGGTSDRSFGTAMEVLIRAGLIEFKQIGVYRLTSAAWRAHLLYERQAKEPPKQELLIGNCARCGIPLDTVATSMYIYARGDERHMACFSCADYFASMGYVVVAQARSIGMCDVLNGDAKEKTA